MRTRNIFRINKGTALFILAIAFSLICPILSKATHESKELRYLTFGTSVTWGSVIKNRFEAYPYLLSPNVTNVAMRASDSSYPSMCTQSMVKDSIYDVIIIEYNRRPIPLLNLVRRLRQRFPNATIVLTKMWALVDIQVTARGSSKKEKLRDWLLKSKQPVHSSEALDFVLKQDVDFSFDKVIDLREKYFTQAEKEYNVKVYDWPTHGDVRDLVKSRRPRFADFVHPNEYGHSVIADDLATLISEEKAKRSERLGSWGEGDMCQSWFHNGFIDNNTTKFISFDNVPMKKFDEKSGKYALELTQERTIFHVYNPFDGPRNLYLTYMASYPNRLYPKVRIECPGSKGTDIDPIAKYDFPVHVQDTKIGCLLKPGKNLVKIVKLPEKDGKSSESPFRLVGIVVTNEVYEPSNLYFIPLALES